MEVLNSEESLVHSMQKGIFPVSGRDLATVTRTCCEPEEKVWYNLSASVIDSKIPEDSKRVRADLAIAGFVFKPRPDNERVIDVSYIVQVDPKGTIPSCKKKIMK